jgi:hypothetical protein
MLPYSSDPLLRQFMAMHSMASIPTPRYEMDPRGVVDAIESSRDACIDTVPRMLRSPG